MTQPSAPWATGAGPRSELGLRRLLVWATVGLLIGALLGFAYGSTRPDSATAEAVITILPEASVTSVALGAADTGQDATAFIQSELIVLTGRQLREQVQTQLGLGTTSGITASQVGLTYVVNVRASAADRGQAVRRLKATVDAYAAQREKALTADIERAVTSVNARLKSVQEALESPALRPRVTGPTDAPPAEARALQEEYGRLVTVNSALGFARGQLARSVTTVQPAAPVDGGPSPAVQGAAAGAVVGVLVALGVLLLHRRMRRRVSDAGELAGLGVPVLLPALPRDSGRAFPIAVSEVSREARLVGARLVPTTSDEQVALVLFGTSTDAGTGFVAAALAAALAERGPVLLLLANDLVGRSTAARLGMSADAPGLADLPAVALTPKHLEAVTQPTVLPGVQAVGRGRRTGSPLLLQRLLGDGILEAALDTGATVVVEAPPLGLSAATVELARRAGGAVLIVGKSRARSDDVVLARDIFAAQDIPLLGALLTNPGRRDRRSLPAERQPRPAVLHHLTRSFEDRWAAVQVGRTAQDQTDRPADEGAGSARSSQSARLPTPTAVRQGGRQAAAPPDDRP